MARTRSERQKRSPQLIADLVRRFRTSGMSQAEFARRHDIAPATLSSWLRKADIAAESTDHGFIPVALPTAKATTAPYLELVFPDGVRLVVPPRCCREDLQLVLGALRAC